MSGDPRWNNQENSPSANTEAIFLVTYRILNWNQLKSELLRWGKLFNDKSLSSPVI